MGQVLVSDKQLNMMYIGAHRFNIIAGRYIELPSTYIDGSVTVYYDGMALSEGDDFTIVDRVLIRLIEPVLKGSSISASYAARKHVG